MNMWLIILVILFAPLRAWAICEVVDPSATYAVGNTLAGPPCGTTGGQRSELSTLLEGEDTDNHVMKVEQQFTGKGNMTADTLVSGVPTMVHTISCQGTDATATAGTIILYDNTAESGTQLWHWDVQAVALTLPFTVTLDMKAATGLYLGYTTTADVNCAISYRQ